MGFGGVPLCRTEAPANGPCQKMTESPAPTVLSPSERGTLQALASGDREAPLDWLAAQRLKQWGLIEDQATVGFRITEAGRSLLKAIAARFNGG